MVFEDKTISYDNSGGGTTRGGAATVGQTQSNVIHVTVSINGTQRSESEIGHDFNHEAGHTGGLYHPWEADNDVSDAKQPDDISKLSPGEKRDIKQNVMNSNENTKSNMALSGNKITKGQMEKVTETIQSQQPSQSSEGESSQPAPAK